MIDQTFIIRIKTIAGLPTLLGIVGVSMGGYLAWYLAARNKAIKAICPLLATPQWEFQDSWSGVGLKPATAQQVAQESPHLQPDRFRGKAIQMHNGTMDQISPISGTRSLYNHLTTLKDCTAELFTYRCDHEVKSVMIKRSIAFLHHHLIEADQPAGEEDGS